MDPHRSSLPSRSVIIVSAVAVTISAAALLKAKWSKSRSQGARAQCPSHPAHAGAHDFPGGGSYAHGSHAHGGRAIPPEAVFASHHISSSPVPGLCEWRDEQIGVCLRYHPHAVDIEGETRVYPVVRLAMQLRDYREFRINFTVEDVVRPISAAEYCDACVEQLRELPHYTIKERRELSVGKGVVFPQLYSAESRWINGELTTVFFVSLFAARGSTAVLFELESVRDIAGRLPDPFFEMLRTFSFTPPQPSPSRLKLTEPRLGLGFEVPLGFVQLPDDIDHRFAAAGLSTSAVGAASEASAAVGGRSQLQHHHGCDARAGLSGAAVMRPLSTFVFANLFDLASDIHLVAKCDTFPTGVPLHREAGAALPAFAHQTLAAALSFFQVEPCAEASARVSEWSGRACGVPSQRSRRHQGQEQWQFLMQLKGVVVQMTGISEFDRMDDAATFHRHERRLRSGEDAGGSGAVLAQQQGDAAGGMRLVIVCCFPLQNEVISLCVSCAAAARSPRHDRRSNGVQSEAGAVTVSARSGEEVLHRALGSLSIGNAHGQDTWLTLCCLRAPFPFQLQLRPGVRAVEPVLGDPLLFCSWPEFEGKCSLLVRYFPVAEGLCDDRGAIEAFLRSAVLATSAHFGGVRPQLTLYDPAPPLSGHTTAMSPTAPSGGFVQASKAAGNLVLVEYSVDFAPSPPSPKLGRESTDDIAACTGEPRGHFLFTPFRGQEEQLDAEEARIYMSIVMFHERQHGIVFQVCTIPYFRAQARDLLMSTAQTFHLL